MPPGKLSLVSVLTHSLPGPHRTDTYRVSGPLASVPDYELSLNITLFIYYERPGNPLLGQSIFVAGAMFWPWISSVYCLQGSMLKMISTKV